MSEAEGSPQAFERKGLNLSGGNVANLVKRISTELQSKSDVPIRASSNDVKQRRVKAAFSYTPQNEDELRLEVDDVIEFLGEEEEGWWKGRLKGRTGVFPANFVKPIETSPWPESRHDTEEKAKSEDADAVGGASASEIQPKKVPGIGFGNIFASNQKIELRNVKGGAAAGAAVPAGDVMKKTAEGPTSITVKDSPVQKGTPTNGKKPQNQISADVPVQKPKEYAKALFAYDAENDDELTLQEGDIISVISKEVEDAGWWMGELNGRRGVFPDNFVSVISAEEAEKARKTANVTHITTVTLPPNVPAKPPKPPTNVSESGKGTPLTAENKYYEIPSASPKQHGLNKVSSENPTKSEISVSEKSTLPATATAVALDKDKPNVFRKPIVPLLGGLTKPKQQSDNNRLISASGANSPNANGKFVDQDSETDGQNASEGDKLIHPTAYRARNPNRRPPSQAFLKDMAIEPSLVSSMIVTPADDSTLPKNSDTLSSFEIINSNGKFSSDSTGEAYVRREEFDKLLAAFESFKRETRERIKELEKLVSSQTAAKSQKL